MGDRDSRGRSGRRRRPAGRWPPLAAQADPVDRRDRATAARVVDVRRRHRGTSSRAASACHGARAPALRAATPGRRPGPAPGPARVLRFPDRSRLSPHHIERRREPSCERHFRRLDLRHPARGARPDVRGGHRTALSRRRRPVAGPFFPLLVARHGGSGHRLGLDTACRRRGAARRARHRLSGDRRRSACRSPSRSH